MVDYELVTWCVPGMLDGRFQNVLYLQYVIWYPDKCAWSLCMPRQTSELVRSVPIWSLSICAHEWFFEDVFTVDTSCMSVRVQKQAARGWIDQDLLEDKQKRLGSHVQQFILEPKEHLPKPGDPQVPKIPLLSIEHGVVRCVPY